MLVCNACLYHSIHLQGKGAKICNLSKLNEQKIENVKSKFEMQNESLKIQECARERSVARIRMRREKEQAQQTNSRVLCVTLAYIITKQQNCKHNYIVF